MTYLKFYLTSLKLELQPGLIAPSIKNHPLKGAVPFVDQQGDMVESKGKIEVR
jgi:hypothetical protein